MISIRKSFDELDQHAEVRRMEELKNGFALEYTMAVRSMAEYAVAVEETRIREFRRRMLDLERRSESVHAVLELQEVQSGVRAELRRYRDEAQEKLTRMRADMAAAGEAMQSMAESVGASGDELESQVKREIGRLQEAAESPEIEVLRDGIRQATAGLAQTYEQLQRSNHMLVAQLQDEIRSLHRELADERRALLTDPASGAWVRQKLESRMEDLLRQGESFWLLLIRINLKELEDDHTKPVASEALRALVKRLQETLGTDSSVGRWAEQVFAVIVELEPAGEEELAQEIRAKLNGHYPVQFEGVNHVLDVHAKTAYISRHRGMKAQEFFLRMGQVAGALAD